MLTICANNVIIGGMDTLNHEDLLATRDDLDTALRGLGHETRLVEDDLAKPGLAINIWTEPGRYPTDTIWVNPDGTFTWGPNFEHSGDHAACVNYWREPA